MQHPDSTRRLGQRTWLVLAALVAALLIYGLASGMGLGPNIASDRQVVAECWNAIDRTGKEHAGRAALVEGCRRMERGFQHTHGSKP